MVGQHDRLGVDVEREHRGGADAVGPAESGRQWLHRANDTGDVRPLPAPFDDIAAGRPARIGVTGPALLGSRLLTKDLAFPDDERDGVPAPRPAARPDRSRSTSRWSSSSSTCGSSTTRWSGTSAWPRSRTATRRCSIDCSPNTSTSSCPSSTRPPWAGRARSSATSSGAPAGRGSRPADIDRIPELLRQGPFEDVRLIVVTDNERILGLGDQGAGGMAIPIGKLALYTAACGIHPSLTLPVSLDVGTDNPCAARRPAVPRLSGAPAARRRLRRARRGVRRRRRGGLAGLLIQFEDFKQQNALRLLDRYQDRVPSFNDDIQGTAAVVVAGVLAAMRADRPARSRRRGSCSSGAGAAGIGIARLLAPGWRRDRSRSSTRTGSSTPAATDLDPSKAALAVAAVEDGSTPDLIGTIAARPAERPGRHDRGRRHVQRGGRRGDGRAPGPAERPIVLPLSNPTAVVRGDAGRRARLDRRPRPRRDRLAVRSRSSCDGRTHVIGQANNAFIFPGVGLGAIVAEARTVTDRMFLLAAQDAGRERRRRTAGRGRAVPADRRACGTCRAAIAIAVADARPGAERRWRPRSMRAMWWPDYVPYLPVRHRRARRRGGASMTTIVARGRARDGGRAGRRSATWSSSSHEPARSGCGCSPSGVCHSDLHVRDGEWDRPTPIVMGHEGAGVVEARRAGRDHAPCRSARRVVVAHPVRDVPVVPARARVGLSRLPVVPAHPARRRDRPCRPVTANPCAPTARSGRWPRPTVVPAAAAIPLPDGDRPGGRPRSSAAA